MKTTDKKQVPKRDIYEIVGENIRLFRQKHGYSLNTLAMKAGVSLSFVSNIEKGRRKATLYTIEKIAEALDCGIYRLLTPRRKEDFLPEESAIILDIIRHVTPKDLERKKTILNIVKQL
jgi:transcriptional regulator with XRE-family HTH domain